ncbi:MAG TPA: hypothetical protein VF331_04780 [Polyangiales bacterium]
MSALVYGVAALVAAIVCWQLAHRQWMPTGDCARTWLSVTDIGGPNTPLVGAHSRFENGWFHPGPAQQFYLWVFHTALGGRLQSSLVASLFAALAVGLALGLWLQRLIGAKRTAYFLATYALFCWGLGDRLIDAWNPLLLLCPLVLLVVACWALAMGSANAIPAVVGLASFVVQCHLGLLPVTLALSVTALGSYAFARWRQSPREPLAKPLLATLAVFLFFWALPLWEELTHSPGNMTLIWRYFLGAEPSALPLAGWRMAARVAAAHLLPWGPWLTERDTPWIFLVQEADNAWLLLPVCTLGLVAESSWERRDSSTFRLTLLLGAMLVASLFTLAQIRGPAYTYLALFTRVIVMFMLSVVAVSLFDPDPARASLAPARATLLRSGSIAGACILVCLTAATIPMTAGATARAYLQMAPAIQAALPAGMRVRVRAVGPMLSAAQVESLAVIAKQVTEIDVPPESSNASAAGTAADEHAPLLLVASGAEVMALKQAGQGRLVAAVDTLPAPARRAADKILAELLQQMHAAGQDSEFARLDNPRPDAQEGLPANVSRPLLLRYQALAQVPNPIQLAVFFFQAPSAASPAH